MTFKFRIFQIGYLEGEVSPHLEREKRENSILVEALLLLPGVLGVGQLNGDGKDPNTRGKA